MNYVSEKFPQYQTLPFSDNIIPCYSRVPNKRTGAFNRTEEKKQPELISVQCTINVQRRLNCQN